MGVDPVAKIPDLLLLSIPIVWFTPELFEYVTRKCRLPSTFRTFATTVCNFSCEKKGVKFRFWEKGGY